MLCPSFAVRVPTFQIWISVRLPPYRLSKQSFYFHIIPIWFYFSLFISAQVLLIRNAFRDTSGKDFNIPFSGTVAHLHNKHKFSIYILYEKEKLWSQSRWVLSKRGASVACLSDKYQAQFCAVSVGLFCVSHSCRRSEKTRVKPFFHPWQIWTTFLIFLVSFFFLLKWRFFHLVSRYPPQVPFHVHFVLIFYYEFKFKVLFPPSQSHLSLENSSLIREILTFLKR